MDRGHHHPTVGNRPSFVQRLLRKFVVLSPNQAFAITVALLASVAVLSYYLVLPKLEHEWQGHMEDQRRLLRDGLAGRLRIGGGKNGAISVTRIDQLHAKGRSVSVVVLIKSAAKSRAKRRRLRNLWVNRCNSGQWRRAGKAGSVKANVMRNALAESSTLRCYFVVGQPVGGGRNISGRTEKEREMVSEGDVLVAAVEDSYAMLAAKTFWALRWSAWQSSTEQRYDYVIMADDDAYLALDNMMLWLSVQPSRGFYSGHEHFELRVVCCQQSPDHPNCVDCRLYTQPFYPPFASGFTFVLSRDAARKAVVAMANMSSAGRLPGNNVEDALIAIALGGEGIRLRDEPGFVHYVSERRGCPPGVSVLAIGNAVPAILHTAAENERAGREVCHRLPRMTHRDQRAVVQH